MQQPPPRSRQDYSGPERRRYRVYITQNTEYHLERDLCVAVRDRSTQRFVKSHLALGRTLEGTVRFLNGVAMPCFGEPEMGDALYFRLGDQELITSPLCGVERPALEDVARYRHAS